MFRNFYAEQNMADPRDSWYKPNLLYNIHYRPPKQPTPPEMMVVTRKFNPSMCTCGEHGCGPHYRIEREVVWLDKEVKSEEDTELKEKKQDGRTAKFVKADDKRSEDNDDNNDDDEEDDDDDDDEIYEERKNVVFSKDMVDDMKEKLNGMIEKEVEMRTGILIAEEDGADECKAGIKVQRYHAQEQSELDQQRSGLKSQMKKMEQEEKKVARISDDLAIERTDLDSLPRFDGLTNADRTDNDVSYTTKEYLVRLVEIIEEFGSAFGIMGVYCKSELHSTWNTENQIHDHMVTE